MILIKKDSSWAYIYHVTRFIFSKLKRYTCKDYDMLYRTLTSMHVLLQRPGKYLSSVMTVTND